jgi:DGQHR domain-containing protein
MITKLKKSKRRKKRNLDPVAQQRKKQILSTRAVFKRVGFKWIKADSVQFQFDGRTGEIDDIMLLDNILLIAEYTSGKPDNAHLAKKSILFEKILKQSAEWVVEYQQSNAVFAQVIQDSGYQPEEFQIFVVYASLHGADQEIEHHFKHYRFLDGTRLRYFDALGKTIFESAKHEFFNYLGVDLRRLGRRVNDSSDKSKNFNGYVLPEANSGYQKGFKVVSFYADPATLLEMSYVLRKDSWRDDDGLYQRILIKGKIGKMRQYLTTARRVFVNNIIVTLPNEALINEPGTGKNVDNSQLSVVRPVTLSIPLKANMIGLVDGQHRVFSYHEAPNDPLDKEIAKQRTRQNLLVTGLIFPSTWSDKARREFEAKLFLEINDTQARAKSVLKHSIEVILNPFSTLAIAKEVTNRLSKSGALAGMLQTNFFDPPDRIKTSSIVSYGLRPLVKTDGEDSLYFAWKDSRKALLNNKDANADERKEVLAAYLSFCAKEINDFLLAAKLAIDPNKWRVSSARDPQLLSTTTINGFLVCIRLIIENKEKRGAPEYSQKLAGLRSVNFKAYKSSAWKSLGEKIYAACYTKL